MLQLPLRVYGLRSGEFKVKVRSGSTSRPVYMKRDAIMVIDIAEKDLIISYSNFSTVIKANKISQVPWLPPRGNMLRFVVGERNDEEMILEFEDHENMLNAFNIFKSTFLAPSQFLKGDELHRGRGLFTNLPQEAGDEKEFDIKSRHERIKEQMFEKLGSSSSDVKRPRTSEPLHELAKESRKPEEHPASSPLRSTEPVKITEDKPISIVCDQQEQPSEPAPDVILLGEDQRNKHPFLRREDPPGQSGLANIGNTCYMNSMLQGLFGMEFFTKELFKFCKEIQNRDMGLVELMPMSFAVSSLASLRDVATPAQQLELLRAVKEASHFRGNAQQDANEFLIRVLSQIQDECDRMLREHYGTLSAEEKRLKNPVTANFAFTMRSTIVCDGCRYVSRVEEDNTILPVDIVGLDRANSRCPNTSMLLTSLQTLLDEFLETEKVERSCEHCDGKSGQRTLKFVRLPRCLIIFSKRYVYDASRSLKRDDRIDIPKYLTLDGHCTEAYSSFPPVPASTLEIDFSTASPLMRRWSAAVPTSSAARRRLDFSVQVKAADTTSRNGPPSSVNISAKGQGRDQAGLQSATEMGQSRTSRESSTQTVSERSWLRKDSYDSSGPLSPEDEEEEEEEEYEVPRELTAGDDSSFNMQNSSSGRNSSSDEGRDEVARWIREKPKNNPEFRGGEVQYNSSHPIDYRNGVPKVIDDGSEIDAKEIDTHNSGNVEGTSRKIGENNLPRSAGESEIMKMNGKNCKFPTLATGKDALNCKLSSVSAEKDVTTSISDEQKKDEVSESTSPGSSTDRRSLSSDTGEIIGEFAAEIIPYKPLDIEKREAFCVQMGLKFVFDCLEQTDIRVMSPQDRPAIVGNVIGDGNCLFRALCFYLSGSDGDYMEVRRQIVEFEMEHWCEFMSLKGYSEEKWKEHTRNLVDDATWGTEIELFAVAAMLKVDVWTYYGGRWLNYRPMFEVRNGETIAIPIADYRVGENEGIYLVNEDEHYAPVLYPSNAILLKENKKRRNKQLLSNIFSGYMLPSYRLLSVISHIGRSSEFGHYICDVWNKRFGWLLCDDDSVVSINEGRIRERSNVGYIYLYLNTEIFD